MRVLKKTFTIKKEIVDKIWDTEGRKKTNANLSLIINNALEKSLITRECKKCLLPKKL